MIEADYGGAGNGVAVVPVREQISRRAPWAPAGFPDTKPMKKTA
jgi:hypothetical protein